MGSVCSCCSKKERSVEDLLDGSLEDKLLGKREDEVEATTAEEEAWRQRREQLKDEAEMSLHSMDGDEDDAAESELRKGDMKHASLIWDLSDRHTVREARKDAEELVEEDEDEAFGSANEDNDESKEHGTEDEKFNDRLTQLSAADSYASIADLQREDTRLFRDTELDSATEVSDTFLAPSSVTNSSFLVDDDDVQKEEHEDEQAEQEPSEGRQSNPGTGTASRRRTSKKKSRSRKSK